MEPERGAGAEARLGLSPTVRAAREALGSHPVPVSTLIEEILDRHASDYLRDWLHIERAWPVPNFVQPADKWIAELAELVAGDLLFGRVAIVTLVLLDPDIAEAAEQSGLLGGLCAEITPDVATFLTPTGTALLRRRAPLVALGEELLPPIVFSKLGLGFDRLAIPRQSPRGLASPRWAGTTGSQLLTGTGSTLRAVDSLEEVNVQAIGYDRSGQLHALLPGDEASGGLVRLAADGQIETEDRWPTATGGSITEDTIVLFDTSRRELWLGGTHEGEPSRLGWTAKEALRIGVAGDVVAALNSDNELYVKHGDQEWVRKGGDRGFVPIAVTKDHILVGSKTGTLTRLGWSESDIVHLDILPGQDILHLTAAGGLVVAASSHELVVVSGGAVIARRTVDAEITAVALSPDRAMLGVATDQGEVRIWRIDRTAELQLSSYTADMPEGEDLLGIDPTVDALAAIVAARAVEPPLSVGLFGAWGSGKTFFMRRLQGRVEGIVQEARATGRPQQNLWAWRNIRHVRFNAWHYGSADVWAGLIEHLMGELAGSALAGALPPELEELHRRRIERLTETHVEADEADKALQATTEDRNKATREVIEKTAAHEAAKHAAHRRAGAAARSYLKEDARFQLEQTLSELGFAHLSDSLEQLLPDLAKARRDAQSVKGLFEGAGRRNLLLVALAGIGLAAIAALATTVLQPRLAAVSASIGWVTGAVVWLHQALEHVKVRQEKLREAESQATAAVSRARDARDCANEHAREAANALDLARNRAEHARAAAEAARSAAASSGPGSLLVEYLAGRNVSADYRSMLGIIGTVRADLEVISTAATQHNSRLKKGEVANDDVVNRIVLYVDDLDRCKPETVVRVLEAVSMLLSYPLFVVVVAVDAHWVSRSLATVYPSLLTGGNVTPDHYLEKVFQLPVWLERPTSDAAIQMALELVKIGEPNEAKADAEVTPELTAAERPVPATARDSASPPSDRQREGELPSMGRPRNVSLATTPPSSIAIDESERTAIARLAPTISRSPRALKRYLNTYRLLKAITHPDALKHVQFLLAVATGEPAIGERLLTEIEKATPDTTLDEIVSGWPVRHQEWIRTEALEFASWASVDCGELRATASQVRRFVFRTLEERPVAADS
jgi:hypothetical protein